MSKPKVIILRTAGTNCDQETQFAFENLGAQAECVHINQLIHGTKNLKDYHILAVPGGFSYGDDIASGKILANELRLRLGPDLEKFIADEKLIIGICNGFQILVKAGILPGLNTKDGGFEQTVTLTNNDSSKFEDRWIHLRPENSICVWTQGMEENIYLPVAHGEGKFFVSDDQVLDQLRTNRQVVFRYTAADGRNPTYPENPNGSLDDIAGICDATGRIFGLMPHPERHILRTQHPSWTRLKKQEGDGNRIFRNGMAYIQKRFL